MNNKLFDSLLTLIKASSVDMEKLFAYYKELEANKDTINEKIINEDIKSDDDNIESDDEDSKVITSPFASMRKIGSWADYEDEATEALLQAELEIAEAKKKAEKEISEAKMKAKNEIAEAKLEAENEINETKLLAIEDVQALIQDDDKLRAKAKKEVDEKKAKKDEKDKFFDDFEKDHWASKVKNGVAKVQNDSEFKTATNNKKNNKKKDLPVVYELEDFMHRITPVAKGGLGQKPNINLKFAGYGDFIIDNDAHCEHTFMGTLCPNVKACGKIHIQRCNGGVNCPKYPKCSFLHMMDMVDDNAKEDFSYTTMKYNRIKANSSSNVNKQVKQYKN